MGEVGHDQPGEKKTLLLRHIPRCEFHLIANLFLSLQYFLKIIFHHFPSLSIAQVAITCVVWSLYVLIDR